MSTTIDLNCDVGEGFGRYALGDDEGVMHYATSANIACGMHAGDPGTMRRTVKLALAHGVAIGAHPGLPDREGFGRRRWDVSEQDVFDLVVYQVGALWGVARSEGGFVRHVKPHGALYHMAAANLEHATAVARAVASIDARLILFALANSELARQGRAAGLQVAEEAFADRTYEPNGTLTPRASPGGGGMLEEYAQAVDQALDIVLRKSVMTRTGIRLSVDAQTLCLHGDRRDAAAFARVLRTALEGAGARVRPVPLAADSPPESGE